MRKVITLVLTTLMLAGCTRFSKVTQLTLQKSEGWKLSNNSSHAECNKVDVIVSAVTLSYESSGINLLFFPITTDRRKSTANVSPENPFIVIMLRHWYRDELLESCALSFVELENRLTLARVHPEEVKRSTSGEHVTKFGTICTYTFDPKELSGEEFDVILSENILGCRLSPIPTVYQKKTIHTIFDLM